MSEPFRVVGLRYPSFYLLEFEGAVAFYTAVFGPPLVDQDTLKGWQLGDTWLTLFPASAEGKIAQENPRNAEFAVQVAAPEQVDALYHALLAAGASSCWEPEDTEMYEPMRFCCLDDPFGIRVDVFCPLGPNE